MERKNFLKAFAVAAAAGPIILDGCKKNSTAKSTTSTTGTSSTTSTSASSSDCVVSPTETEGPYPYVGGELTNPLNRADITAGQTGVPLTLTFLVVNANDNCNLVANARVDIWHCNKDGYYSGYANQGGGKSFVGQTFLRGYQTSDNNGTVVFTTIYPGWYSGRATHIHLEVYVNNVMKKTTQITFSETISDAVHVSSLYSLGVNPTRNASDSILGDSATDLANETVALVGSVSAGYSGSHNIGLAL